MGTTERFIIVRFILAVKKGRAISHIVGGAMLVSLDSFLNCRLGNLGFDCTALAIVAEFIKWGLDKPFVKILDIGVPVVNGRQVIIKYGRFPILGRREYHMWKFIPFFWFMGFHGQVRKALDDI
jgi:hypothetical protein